MLVVSVRRCLIMLLLLGVLALPGTALAHAHLVRADLAPDSDVRVPAGTVRFWFDEAVNPALSRIIIRDAQGQQVNTDTGRPNPADNEELDVTVPALPDGQYSVLWTSDSAQDGHVMHGFYVFNVGGPGAASLGSTPPPLASVAGPALDTTSLVVALAHWLVLVASAIWAGALALEVLVLAPARLSGPRGSAGLATEAALRTGAVVRMGLAATLLASLLELETQAYAAAGDWSGLISTSVLDGIINSHYGNYWVARVLLAFLALLIVGLPLVGRPARRRGPVRASGGGAWSTGHVAAPLGPLTAQVLAVVALVYLLALALSGHAAAVPGLVVTSVLLDWLHLVAMGVWIGGMAAIALILLPALPVADHGSLRERGLEFLGLLDRFSPAAYMALITAAATGMFNTQVHLSTFDDLTGTAYGRFLLIKLALIGEIMLLSASHVLVTRPRLRALPAATPAAALEEGYASLAVRLRVEPLIGAFILLCVALMGQVAPSTNVFSVGATPNVVAAPSPTPEVQQPITGLSSTGSLTVRLQINPPAVGSARFSVNVDEGSTVVADGQVRIKLSMPSNPSLGAVFVETTPGAGTYNGSGDLVQAGVWRADVLVRTRSDPSEYRDVPFLFLAGPDAQFLSAPPIDTRYGPATPRLSTPAAAPDTLAVLLRPGLQVRYVLSMPSMPGMGTADFLAQSQGGGWYGGTIILPMAGITYLGVEVHEGSSWHLVRLLIYQVDDQGQARLLV